MCEALVEYDYKAQEPDELTIKKGDIITDIEIRPGGWWEGTLSRLGKRGMFPDNFVKLLGDSNTSQETKSDSSRAVAGRKCKVLFSYKPANDDELELQIDDIIDILGEEEEGWWRGKLRNQIGVFPSNFVLEMENTDVRETAARKPKLSQDETPKQTVSAADVNNVQHSPNSTLVNNNDHDAPVLPPKPSKEMCKVLFAYEAANDDELSLLEGDMITLITKEGQDVGWWKGELRGKIGVFPDNFVQLIPADELIKPDRPAKVVTTNRIRDSITKPVPNPGRKFSDSSKPPEEKVSPPSVSKKPTLPPPPLKKPLRSPSGNDLSKSSTVPSLVSKQPDSPTSGISSRIPHSSFTTSSQKFISSSSTTETLTTSSSSANAKWCFVEGDSMDGSLWSRQSYTVNTGTSSSGINVASGVINSELDLDLVSRAAMLTHPTASRAKAPRRRPPSSITNKDEIKEDVESPESLMNGNAEIPMEKSPNNKAPWVEELKLNQAKKSMQVGRTRVLIGPPQTDPVVSPETSPTKPVLAGVTLRSQPIVGPRPHSMFTSTKPSTPPAYDETATVTMKQWNELSEKVTRLETYYESKIETLIKTVKDLTEIIEEERQRRLQMQLEIEKLTDLVTQV